jgi:hypothetical protein
MFCDTTPQYGGVCSVGWSSRDIRGNYKSQKQVWFVLGPLQNTKYYVFLNVSMPDFFGELGLV